MLEADLAELYGVPTKAFNQAIKRNRDRLPEDFMFQLTEIEMGVMRSRSVTASKRNIRYQGKQANLQNSPKAMNRGRAPKHVIKLRIRRAMRHFSERVN